MKYMELMNYLSTLNIETIDLGSPELLATIIQNKKSEFYQYFFLKAWTAENLKLLVENINNEDELLFLTSYNFNNIDEIIKNEFINALMDKNYYTFLISELGFANRLQKNPKCLKKFLSSIKTINISYRELDNLLTKDNKELIIEEIIKSKRIDYISFLLRDGYFNERDTYPLIPLINEIYKFMNMFDIKPHVSIYKNNLALFKQLFLLGDLEGIKRLQYMGYDQMKSFINSDEEILNKIVEYAKTTTDEEFIKVTQRIPNLQNRSDYLKVLLERNNYSIINFFNLSAWNLENQTLYLNLLNEDKNVPSFSLESKCPLISYKKNYIFGRIIPRDTTYTNIDNNDNFNNYDICMKIGKDITNGTIENNSIITKFYQFIYTINSKNIYNLILALTEKNINNLSRLFDENGITQYFKEYLLFDTDYIIYKSQGILEEVTTAEYANYLKILYLDEKMREYIKDLFIDNNNLLEYINEDSVTRKFIDNSFNKKGMTALAILINNEYNLPISDTEKKTILTYLKIEDNKIKEIFLDYCIKNKETIEPDQIDNIYDLITKITNSNSYEIRKQSNGLINKLINLDNYKDVYNELEYIFTHGATPEFIKRFVMYKMLYGDKDISKDSNVTSPILKSVSREEADKIIIKDLLRVSLATNSKDIKNYFNILQKGERLYQNTKREDIKESALIELLHEYRIRLEFLCKYLLKLDYISKEDDYETIYNIEKSYMKSKGMVFDFDFHLPLMVSSMIEDIFGTQLIVLETYMGKHAVLKTVLEESKKVRNIPLEIKAGDFLKGIDSQYLDNIFGFGSLSIEFLGESASEDVTHLDTDMSLIGRDIETIPELLNEKLTACNWGDMKLIISREYMDTFQEYIITKDKTGIKEFTEEDKNKYEIFTYAGSQDHYCIRTGFPITYVKGIIATRNYSRAKHIVIKNDFFVPIYDKDGKLIFSYEDYYRERKALQGLSYYGKDTYEISDNLSNPSTEEIQSLLENNRRKTTNERTVILSKLNEVFSKYFTGIKYQINSSVQKGFIEIIDTGSTGRNTNLIDDGDFDFILRLDQEFINSDKLKEFSSDIYKLFGKPVGNERIIRLEDIKIEGIENPLKLDLTIIDKNSKIDYSTDMCITDRLNTIKRLYPDKYDLVISNIIFAKTFFKKLDIYKRYNGGFGGVGIENFILKYGGSFYDAAKNFVEIARSCKDLTEFKERYHIYDFGKNHYTYSDTNKKVDFPYDDYVNALTPKSYEEIIKAFEEYLNINKQITI